MRGGDNGDWEEYPAPPPRSTSIALSKAERAGLVFAFVMVMVVWVCIGLWIADGANAASLEVGSYSGVETREIDHEYTTSTTESTSVVICVVWHSFPRKATVMVGGVQVGFLQAPEGVTGESSGCLTFDAAPSTVWRVKSVGPGSGQEVNESHASIGAASGGGAEGPEGKEGKEGKEGPPGAEGKEGPPGPEGSGSGAGKSEVTSFGAEAQATFSEGLETMETIGWCLVGTLMACAVALMVWRVVTP